MAKINCVSPGVLSAPNIKLAYRNLSSADKEAFILEWLAANPTTVLPEALSRLSDVLLVKVDKNDKPVLQFKLSNSYMQEQLNQTREQLDEAAFDFENVDQKAFHNDKESIDKSSVTHVVNFYLNGMPLLSENNAALNQFNANITVSSNRATSLVWSLANRYPQAINSKNDLREFLQNSINSQDNTKTDNQTLNSLYKMLFSQEPFKVSGNGFDQTYYSFDYLSQHSPEAEIRLRNSNILSMFLSYFNSVRKSALVTLDNDSVMIPAENVYMEEKNRMNEGLFFNLFSMAIDPESQTQSMKVNQLVRDEFQKNRVKISNRTKIVLKNNPSNKEVYDKIQMQPDNINKILSGEKTITNRTSFFKDGIYEMPDGNKIKIELLGEAKVSEVPLRGGNNRIMKVVEIGDFKGVTEEWPGNEFAKAEGFKDWDDFEKNNKFSKEFISGKQKRYVFSVKPFTENTEVNKNSYKFQDQGYKLNIELNGINYFIPFQLNFSKREDLVNVDLQEMENFPKDALYTLLDIAGYKSNVIDPSSLDNYLKSGPTEVTQKAIADLALSSALVMAFNIDTENIKSGQPRQVIDNNIPLFDIQDNAVFSPAENFLSLADLMDTKYGRLYTSPANQRNVIRKLFPGYQINKSNTFVFSPSMFFVGNGALAKQIVQDVGMLESRVQKNQSGDDVGKFAIQSNVYRLSQLAKEVQEAPVSALAGNPIGKAYQILNTYILDGFSSDSMQKDHMNMDEFEFNTTLKRIFTDSVLDNYLGGSSGSRALIPLQVFSDKTSFSIADVVATSSQHGFFPLKDMDGIRTVDIERLLENSYQHFVNNTVNEMAAFVRSWLQKNSRGQYQFLSDINTYAPEYNVAAQGVINILEAPVNDLLKIQTLASHLEQYKIPANLPYHLTTNLHYENQGGSMGIKKYLVDSYTQIANPDAYKKNLLGSLSSSNWSNQKIGMVYNDRQKDFLLDNNIYNPAFTALEVDPTLSLEENIQRAEQAIHPYHSAYFFAYNNVSLNAGKMMFGQLAQYKGTSEDKMMGDQLKRSIAAVAPYHTLSIDKTGTEPNRIAAQSYTLHVKDDVAVRQLLNGEASADATDGFAVLNPLATMAIQDSYGGLQGLYPKSVLKLINLDVDVNSGVRQMYKYAAKDLSQGVYNLGNDKIRSYLSILLDTIPLNHNEANFVGPVNVQHTFDEKPFIGSYQGTDTLLSVLSDMQEQLGGSLYENIPRLYTVINSAMHNGKLILKDKYVDQIVFASAIKTGQKNILTSDQLADAYLKKDGHLLDKINTISNTRRGIQLDAIHDPEHKGISLISQLFNNSALEGWDTTETDAVYRTLGEITDLGGAQVFKYLNTDFTLSDTGLTPDKIRYNGDEVSFNNLPQKVKRNVFIRAITMDALETQGSLTDIYQILMDNPLSSFSENPQLMEKVASAISAFINKNTVNPKMEGGHYVLIPGHFFHVYDVVAPTGERSVITRDRLDSYIAKGYTVGTPRELKWKGYTKTNADDSEENLMNTKEWNDYMHLSNAYNESLTKATADPNQLTMQRMQADQKVLLDARAGLQQLLSNGGWSVSPAEFIMPNVFKTEFGLTTGLQPGDINVDYFVRQYRAKLISKRMKGEKKSFIRSMNEDRKSNGLGNFDGDTYQEIMDSIPDSIDTAWTKYAGEEVWDAAQVQEFEDGVREMAENKMENFSKSLQTLVNRIPSTGLQSVVHGKIVGFLEGDYNVLAVPSELLMIQGADFDIDKAAVLHPKFDKNGQYIYDTTSENLPTKMDALKNNLFDSIQKLVSNAKNALQSDTAVSLAKSSLIRSVMQKNATAGDKFQLNVPETVVKQKILASEGKAMVGVFANALKTYALSFYAYNKSSNKDFMLKPLQFSLPSGTKEYRFLANTNGIGDMKQGHEQVWKFYSELTNAATDNAKELILGAIRANLQTGNMINAGLMYGIDPIELFSFMNQPEVLDVFSRIKTYGRAYEESFNQVDIQKEVKKTIANFKAKDEPVNLAVLDTLAALYADGEEFNVLALTLGINRQLPRSTFDKLNYNLRMEDYINKNYQDKQVKEKQLVPGKTDLFSMEDFIKGLGVDYDNDSLYVQEWTERYGEQKKGLNIIEVIRQLPHIRANMKIKNSTDEVLSEVIPVYDYASNLMLDTRTKNPVWLEQKVYEGDILVENRSKFINSFAKLREEEFNKLVGYLNNTWISDYLTNTEQKEVLYFDSNNSREFDLGNPDHVNAFVQVFPSYLDSVRNLTIDQGKTNMPQNEKAIDQVLSIQARRNGLSNVRSGSDKVNDLDTNKFFTSLKNTTNQNGSFLYIPNVDVLSDSERHELKFHFATHNGSGVATKIITPGNIISYQKLQKQVFLYSLITSKSKVGKFSFIDLIDTTTRKPLLNHFEKGIDFTALNLNPTGAAYQLLSLYPSFASAGIGYNRIAEESMHTNSRTGQQNMKPADVIYLRPEVLQSSIPKYLKHFRFGQNRLFQLINVGSQLAYSRMATVYDTISLSQNVSGYNELSDATVKRAKINNPQDVKLLLEGVAVADNYFQAVLKGEDFEARTQIGKVIAYEDNGTRRLALKQQVNPFVKTALSGRFVDNMIDKLSMMFPGTNPIKLYSEEIARQYGELYSNNAAFIKDGQLVFNMDKIGLDTPIHEFGHIFMAELKREDPSSYFNLINQAVKLDNPVANRVRQTYANLTTEEMGEEVFVSMLGVEGVESLKRNINDSTFSFSRIINHVLGKMKNFFAKVFSSDYGKAKATLQKFDFSNMTVQEALFAISDTIAPDLLKGLNNDEKNYITQANVDLSGEYNLYSDPNVRFSKAAFVKQQQKINSIETMLRALTGGRYFDTLRKKDDDVIAGEVEDYIKNKIKGKGEKSDYKRRPWMRFVDRLLIDYNEDTDTIAPLSRILKTDFVDLNVGELPVKKIFVLKRSIGDGTYSYQLIHFSDKPPYTNYTTSRKNIAGAFVNDVSAGYQGIDLENNHHGNTMMMLGLIGMQMKQQNKLATKIGNMYSIYYKSDSDDNLQGEYFDRVVNNIKGIAELPEIKGAFSGPMQSLLSNQELLDRGNYRYNRIAFYKTWLDSILAKPFLSPTAKEHYSGMLEDVQFTSNRKQMKAILNNRLMHLVRRHRSENNSIYDDNRWSGQEMRILTEVLAELNGMDKIYLDKFDMSKFRAFVASPGKSGSPLFEKLFEIITNTVNDIRNKFFGDFKVKTAKETKAIIKDYQSKDSLNSLQGITFGSASSVFDGLYEKLEAEDRDGNKSTVYTGRFWPKDSDNYKRLSEAQRNYIVYANGVNDKYVQPFIDQGKISNLIPLMKEDPWGIIGGDLKKKEYIKAFNEGVERWWNKTMNNSEYFIGSDDTNRKEVSLKFDRTFQNPEETKYGSLERLSFIGLTYDPKTSKLIIDDSTKNSQFEKNLEYTMNYLALNSMYKSEMEKEAVPMYHIAKAYISVAESSLGKNVDGLEQLTEDYVTRLIYNMNNKTGGFESLEKAANVATAAMSSSLLGLNINADIKNIIGGQINTLATSMKNYMVNAFGADSLFTTYDFARATQYCLNPANFDTVNALMELYGMTTMDYDSILSSRNNVTGQKLFKHENLFWLNYRGDKYNRGIMFIAQLMHEGVMQAHSMQNGKLVYDESKDPRFKGEDGASYKKALKASLDNESDGVKGGKLQKAYDNKLRNKLKLLADDMYGSYDKETATSLQNYWWGRALTSFGKYLPNKIQSVLDPTSKNEVFGNYVTREVNGVRITNWEGQVNEGLFSTFRFLWAESLRNKKVAWSSLSATQKKNAASVVTDSFTFGLTAYVFSQIISGIFGDDEDELSASQKALRRSLASSYMEAFALYDARTYTKLSEPFVVTSYFGDLVHDTYLWYGGEDKNAGERALRKTAFGMVYRIGDVYSLFDPDDYENK